MKKLLFNINSTSWFYTTSNGKVVKLEVFFLLMSIATFLGAIGVGYEGVNDIDFGVFSLLMIAPFVILILQYFLYSQFGGVVSKSVQDQYWKTQLWRFRDPTFAMQRSLYPNWENRMKVLEDMWLEEYDETANETMLNAPWIQKYRIVILIGAGLLGLLVGMFLI